MEVGRKADAVRASLAAVKHTGAAITFSTDNFIAARKLLQGLSQLTPVDQQGRVTLEGMDAGNAAVMLSDLYDDLAGMGFHAEHIEEALQAQIPVVSRETALDWLCYNLAADSLPRTFVVTGSTSSNDPAKVVAVAATPQRSLPEGFENRKEGVADAAWQKLAQSKARQAPSYQLKPVASPKSDPKRWLTQYMHSHSESETSSEDWDAFSQGVAPMTQQEKDLRKMALARARLPVQERRRLAAVDMATAMQEASAAKVARNKARQQAAGLRIRDLKKELEELGIDEGSHQQLSEVQSPAEAAASGVIVKGNCGGTSTPQIGSPPQRGADDSSCDKSDSDAAAVDMFQEGSPDQGDSVACSKRGLERDAGGGNKAISPPMQQKGMDVYRDSAFWQSDDSKAAALKTAVAQPPSKRSQVLLHQH